MGLRVIKVGRDEDVYLLWSTYTDRGVWVDDRIGTAVRLLDEGVSPRDVKEVIERADLTGTSSQLGDGGWDADGLWTWRSDGVYGELPRESFLAYAQAFLVDDRNMIDKMIVPDEDQDQDEGPDEEDEES